MLKEIKKAFTLAEVLIVIGIIGVVAALTLPNLNHATGDKEKVTKVKKIYSNLTEAVDRAQAIYGPFDTWFNDFQRNSDGYIDRSNIASANERFAKRVTEFMKISKDCGLNEGCFSTTPFLFINGEARDETLIQLLQSENAYMVSLLDGMSLGFTNVGPFFIYIDIDGPNKGKNMDGTDIFNFCIYYKESSANSDGAKLNQVYPSYNPISWTGNFDEEFSTAWVIENGNLDYLKCPDELNWETKTSCE